MAAELKKDFFTEWAERVAAEYKAAVERGEHDGQCEYDVTGFYLCHCSKRRREAKGITEVPTDDLDFPPPDCPRCFKSLVHDGESWRCYGCSLTWDSNGAGDSATFTDDYGDLTATKKNWRAVREGAPVR